MSYDDIDDLFGGGGGPPTAKLSQPGDEAVGIIYKMERRNETDDEDNIIVDPRTGKPKPLMVLHLITKVRDPEVEGDDGTRRLWLKGNGLWALQVAVRECGPGVKPRVGGMVKVWVDSLKPNPNRNRKPIKQHGATYWLPTTETEVQAFAMASVKDRPQESDELFTGSAATPAAEQAQQSKGTRTVDSMRKSFDEEPPF
jgi:hypothetical protein